MRILSGIQPTGAIHLGNYFGALVNWVTLQNKGYECFYAIVNLHAITLPQDPHLLRQNIRDVAATLLAIGIDPSRSTLFVQSDVSAHSELAWVLANLAPMGLMERMIQFKEKSQLAPETVNLGLLMYPVLQAADILLYKPQIVPVGIDQAQHLELTRDLAQKFNTTFKHVFPLPETLHTKTQKVVGLDGSAKMSKSRNNYIGIVEEESVIWKKLSVATTDPARIKRSDPGNPQVCNIYALHELFSTLEDLGYVDTGCRSATIGCIDCKRLLFERMMAHLRPIRSAYLEWQAQPKKLDTILEHGAERARAVAQQTLCEVYDAIGFQYKM